ncbi:MAG TPA: LysR family transcriptional regulator, partial [Rhodospirillales bacterium]|nr:LysR family transcriptional regulator [Rhodospirillales bacterium]
MKQSDALVDSLNELFIFTKVVDAGGFTAAARRINRSKSTVSKLVSRLEDRLGARLLNRTTRRLSLTEEGAAFYERSLRILAEIEDAELAVGRLHSQPRGTLRINAPMSFGILHVTPALPDFMARYPDLEIDFILNDRQVDLIDEGFDVAVRIARLTDSTLIAKRLASFRQVVCAAPGYWRAHGKPDRPEDMRGHNCLIYTYRQNQNEWPFQTPDGPVSIPIEGSLHANNGDVMRLTALAGSGVYLGPTFIVGDDLRKGRLISVLDDYAETDRAIYAVYPQNRHLSAKVRVFIDFLVDRFGPKP